MTQQVVEANTVPGTEKLPVVSIEEQAMTSLLPVAPGRTGQIFSDAVSGRLVDLVATSPSTQIVSLMFGLRDIPAPKDRTWGELLAEQDVSVRGGEQIIAVVRNLGDAVRPLSLSVAFHRSAASHAAPGKKRGAASKAAPGVGELATSPGVRFVVQRGYLPYLLRFVREGGMPPKTVRGVLVEAFSSPRHVRGDGAAPLGSASVELVMPVAIRSAIAHGLRHLTAARLHPTDRETALVALVTAMDAGTPATEPQRSMPALQQSAIEQVFPPPAAALQQPTLEQISEAAQQSLAGIFARVHEIVRESAAQNARQVERCEAHIATLEQAIKAMRAELSEIRGIFTSLEPPVPVEGVEISSTDVEPLPVLFAESRS